MWRTLDAPLASDAASSPSSSRPTISSDGHRAPIETRRGRRIAFARTSGGIWLGYLGGAVRVETPTPGAQTKNSSAQHKAKAPTGTLRLRAPMAGRIVAQYGSDGAPCRKGETLVVLEAMKMEYRICAPSDGHVAQHYGAPGDAVALDCVLAVFVCDADG